MRLIVGCQLTGILFLSASNAVALDASRGPLGANHLRAHSYATGAAVKVGVFDTVPLGIPLPHHLGTRLIAQYDFFGKSPPQSPGALANPVDDHERLAADIIASHDPLHTGVAPGALIYLAAIDDLNIQSRRAASAWLNAQHDVAIFSLSAGFGANANGSGADAMYWDWFMRDKNAVLVVSAGNSGGQLLTPADSFNDIAVGAYDEATQARWPGSAYQLNGGMLGPELRGKPDILAPGVWVGDGISFDGYYSLGTSFAAPHVTGTAALLADYAASTHPLPLGEGASELPLPPGEGWGEGAAPSDALNHLGIKALILNSARKRHIIAPETTSPQSSDSALADISFDKDYLNCTSGPCAFANPSVAATTPAWTPTGWTFDGAKFSTAKPLDDEQGAGFLDAARAVVNLAGGNYARGPVAGIGWDQNIIAPNDEPMLHTYALNQALAAGSFLTATLVWDRVVMESDGDSVVDDDDTYSFGELANLDLRLLDEANAIVAESISTTDNVEHLHIPLPANGNTGDYKLQVSYNGGGVLATHFALAWWTSPAPLVPGDYNLDGLVDALDCNVWRASFGSSTATTPLVYGDGNADGLVDAADYIVWRAHFGESWITGAVHQLAAVPECSSLLLSILATIPIGCMVRRSRMRLF